MTSEDLRKLFFDFFKNQGHTIVPSSSLIPTSDPTVLLTTAGMLQFKPYLLGTLDPVERFGSRNVVSIQKCFRTTDIEMVGDESHLTFFEMMGNFSFGGYFKERAVALSFEFLLGRECLGLEPQRLLVTAFKGDDQIPADNEAIRLWQEQFRSIGIEAKLGERLFLYGRDKNWWELDPGPAGPDAEMFYELKRPHQPQFGSVCHPNCDCGRFVEIGNDVFVQYYKTEAGEYEPLPQKAIDNGRGLERLLMVVQGKSTVFETDLFEPLRSRILEVKPDIKIRDLRIILDHVRGSTFLVADGLRPSNLDRGYVLRRVLRRLSLRLRLNSINFGHQLQSFIQAVSEKYSSIYPEVGAYDKIVAVVTAELAAFEKTLMNALRRFDRQITGAESAEVLGEKLFDLYATYGLPFELAKELLLERAIPWSAAAEQRFQQLFAEHQRVSRVR